jgi:tetratricopeptide (TPR) repeat protein
MPSHQKKPSPEILLALERGLDLQRAGRLAEAEAQFELVLRGQPGNFDALQMLGLLAAQSGRYERAMALLHRASCEKPDAASIHMHMAGVLQRLGRLEDSVSAYSRAIDLQPGFAEAHNNRSATLLRLNRYHDAYDSADRAIRLRPTYAKAYVNRGAARRGLGRAAESLDDFAMAIQLQPDLAGAYSHRGAALLDLQRVDEATQSCNDAIARDPYLPGAHTNLGRALQRLQRPMEALESFRCAISLDPAAAEAHWNAGLCLVQLGRMTEGWPLYEWRKRIPNGMAPVAMAQREWTGRESIAGQTILIHSEHGLGDTIQFCRYAACVDALGANVVLAVQPVLRRLLSTLGPDITVTTTPEGPVATDFHCPMMSLPLALGTQIDSIPAQVPYLQAETERTARWRTRIGPTGFRVGICWQGASSEIDIGRSVPLREFEAIASIPGVRLISLQKGPGLRQLECGSSRVEIMTEDLDAGPDAFLDTAALIANMDLVITSDTSIAHLSGALACPTWLALQHVPDWRWMLNRSDSPWYPTMRLFRQSRPGDWTGVFNAIRTELLTTLSRTG